MKKKINKKAFTLVELLVVIAILAILATVAIISYSAFIKKAKESNDIYLVKQMNIVLDASKVVDGKNKTMTDALDDVFDKGFDVTKMNPTSSNYNIVWDSINDQMVLLNDSLNVVFPKDNVSDSKYLYVIVDNENEINNLYKDYSFYLKDTFDNVSKSLTIKNGIDVGNNKNIQQINYLNNNKQNVVIRTNGGKLSINAANDTIFHYGLVNELSIESVSLNDCYHEHGYVGTLSLFNNGKFIASKNAVFHQKKTSDDNNDLGIKEIINPNDNRIFIDNNAKYNTHYYLNGKCVICNIDECHHLWVNETIIKEPTCKEKGVKTYTCSLCNTQKQEEINPLGHDYNEWLYENETLHKKVCKNCDDEVSENHIIENGTCKVCNHTFIKDGLVDGYYYEDDNLFTGKIDEYEFIDGKIVINIASKEYVKDSLNSIVNKRIYNFIINNNEYLTKEIILQGDIKTYDSLATINITDNTNNNYVINNITARSQLDDLLSKTNWTENDIFSSLTNKGGKELIDSDYKLINSNKLTSYENTNDDPDLYDVFIPKLCSDSTIIKDYLKLIDCNSINEYYTKYKNDTLIISLADYMSLVYGKGYTLINNNKTIEYKKSFGDNYKSDVIDNFYINIVADSLTGLPKIQLCDKSTNTYFTVLTKIINNKIVFENYVIDADGNTKCSNNALLSQLEFFLGKSYYISISDNVVALHKDSIAGAIVSKFEIDNVNNLIKTYINEKVTDANGIPFSIPSSGSVNLVNGKVQLTGVFDVSKVSLKNNDLRNLVGLSNSETIMFDKEVIELIIKGCYLNTLSVKCNSMNTYSLNDIPLSSFVKNNNTYSASFEPIYSDEALQLLLSNLFNGVDYAGLTFNITLKANSN